MNESGITRRRSIPVLAVGSALSLVAGAALVSQLSADDRDYAQTEDSPRAGRSGDETHDESGGRGGRGGTGGRGGQGGQGGSGGRGGRGGTGGTGGGGSNTSYRVVAWNDLGMHCMDGKDYSVFSILPPYNNLHAQVIDTLTGEHVTQGVVVTYEAVADPSGSTNTSSSAKTNFWSYVDKLFGTAPEPDHGLNLSDPNVSNPTPNATPEPMRYNAALDWFEAEGLPITPYDDAESKNYYPMVEVSVRDGDNKVLASTRTVLPVSDELSCKSCHLDPDPDKWLAPDEERAWKLDVLQKHDLKQTDNPQSESLYKAALAQLPLVPGLAADALLMARVAADQPVLCASCHGSNALGTAGFTVGTHTISALTSAVHTMHGKVDYPGRPGTTLDDVNNRSSCYLCHPGSQTRCLRGAMSEVPDLDCQSCHGNHAAVGQASRIGWLEEPNCQSCHHDGLREITAVTDLSSGALRPTSDPRFATNADAPIAGTSLFRFSRGHGAMQCEACHGSTHAEYTSKSAAWASSHDNDTLQTRDLQGYPGPIQECSVCHASVPLTASGGPHGMHSVGQRWVNEHGDDAEHDLTSCQYCHDARTSSGAFANAFQGSALSRVKIQKTFDAEDRSVTLAAGTEVGCYHCHNGPRDD